MDLQFGSRLPKQSQSGEITLHYNDVIMGVIASQITSLSIVYSIVYSDADQRKQQSSASLAFVRGIHREPVNSPHKKPVTRKMFPFDDVIMKPISRLFEKFSGKTSCVLVNRWPNKANLRNLIAATSLVILLKLDWNHQFFSPRDLERWWMTSENYRAPLLHYIKLCPSSQTPR